MALSSRSRATTFRAYSSSARSCSVRASNAAASASRRRALAASCAALNTRGSMREQLLALLYQAAFRHRNVLDVAGDARPQFYLLDGGQRAGELGVGCHRANHHLGDGNAWRALAARAAPIPAASDKGPRRLASR